MNYHFNACFQASVSQLRPLLLLLLLPHSRANVICNFGDFFIHQHPLMCHGGLLSYLSRPISFHPHQYFACGWSVNTALTIYRQIIYFSSQIRGTIHRGEEESLSSSVHSGQRLRMTCSHLGGSTSKELGQEVGPSYRAVSGPAPLLPSYKPQPLPQRQQSTRTVQVIWGSSIEVYRGHFTFNS